MINALVIALLVAIFTIEYAVRDLGLLHPYFILVPELLSAVAMIVVLSRLMAGVRIALDLRYVLVLTLLAFTMVFGFVVQDVPTGAVVAGIRAHLKFIPFFLLPAVYEFTPAQLRKQLVVFMALLLLQTPLALYQRFVQFAHMMETGDPVKGTTTASSSLSLLLLCGIAVAVALYLRGKVKLPVLIVVIGLLFLPTTINETKATLLLLPVALLLPALCMPRGSKTIRKLLPVAAVGALAGFAFVTVYDHLIRYRTYGQPIGDFFTEESFERYLYTRSSDEELNYIGRFDSIEIAFERLSEEPLRLAFGLGAGNVSTSFLPLFDGDYALYFVRYGVDMTQVTNLLWQVGILGLALYLALYYLVFRDAQLLARGSDEWLATIGQIWVTVVVVMTFALLYKSVFSMNEIGYPFWLYSGVVAGYAVKQRRALRAQHVARRREVQRRASGALPVAPDLRPVR